MRVGVEHRAGVLLLAEELSDHILCGQAICRESPEAVCGIFRVRSRRVSEVPIVDR